MIKSVIAVRVDAGPREVAEVTSKYNLLAVPVVDEHNRLQGIVTVDDVMERVMPARAGLRRRRIF
jgi:magnesium transporter